MKSLLLVVALVISANAVAERPPEQICGIYASIAGEAYEAKKAGSTMNDFFYKVQRQLEENGISPHDVYDEMRPLNRPIVEAFSTKEPESDFVVRMHRVCYQEYFPWLLH